MPEVAPAASTLAFATRVVPPLVAGRKRSLSAKAIVTLIVVAALMVVGAEVPVKEAWLVRPTTEKVLAAPRGTLIDTAPVSPVRLIVSMSEAVIVTS